MWDFVSNKYDVVVFRQSCTEEVSKGVVLFVKCEDSRVWRACQSLLDLLEHSFTPLLHSVIVGIYEYPAASSPYEVS